MVLNKKSFAEVKNQSTRLLTELSSISYNQRCSITRQLGDAVAIEEIVKSDNHAIVANTTKDGIIIKLNCGTTADISHTLISMSFECDKDKQKVLKRLEQREADGIFVAK